MRICSLLPSATEILFALGLGDQVVAVTHECDYPVEAQRKPRITTSIVDPELMSSAEIDALVAQALAGGGATYHIDMDVLRQTRPELIITQELCAVCAVDGGEVRRAAAVLDPPPRILSLEPTRVSEILDCVRQVGEAVGMADRAERVAADLAARIGRVRAATAGLARPRVLCVEWLDPPWTAGHWVPEMVELAGGADALARTGEPSRRAAWAEIEAANPEVVILMACGFGVERNLKEAPILRTVPEVQRMAAFREGRVYAVDASSYFSRPGPRIVEGIELLAAIVHPEVFPRELPASAARRLDPELAIKRRSR